MPSGIIHTPPETRAHGPQLRISDWYRVGSQCILVQGWKGREERGKEGKKDGQEASLEFSRNF